MLEKLKNYFNNLNSSQKTNIGLVAALVVIILGSILVYNKFIAHHTQGPLQEVDLPFDPTGPYALFIPRDDGTAATLDVTRVGDADAISYDLEYQSNGIDRGVHGDIKKLGDKTQKSEYTQLILFGTCSQGFTTAGPHCVFDPNVENGTVTLHIQKGDQLYRMITTWHLQKPDVALGKITSADGHFTYTTDADRGILATIAYTIVNDLTGAPKLPSDKKIFGSVYALNTPNTKVFPSGTVSIETATTPPAGAQIARYDEAANGWDPLKTEASGSSTLVAQGNQGGIFTILVPNNGK